MHKLLIIINAVVRSDVPSGAQVGSGSRCIGLSVRRSKPAECCE
jgi:hypothetical protein